MKVCTQCTKRVKGLKYLKDFPKDDFGFCSFSCMFTWLKDHDVKCNGKEIDILSNKKGITVYSKDFKQ